MGWERTLSPIAAAFNGTILNGYTAAHYGDPLGEQRPDKLLIDRAERTVLRVSGTDARDFLTTLLSQSFDSHHGRALRLDAHGYIQDSIIWVEEKETPADREGPSFLLYTHPDSSLADFLEKMLFWNRVWIDELPDYGVLTLIDRKATTPTSVFEAPVAWRGPARTDLILPKKEMVDTASHYIAQGYHLAGRLAWDALRVRALEPEVDRDLDGRSVPHEIFHFIGTAVNLHKGCYPGQETVARIENLGRSPRVLVICHLDGSVPQLPGEGYPISGLKRNKMRPVGTLGTIAQDYEYGPTALALIQRNATGLELESRVGDIPCSITIDLDTLVNDNKIPAGRRAIDRLRGHVVD